MTINASAPAKPRVRSPVGTASRLRRLLLVVFVLIPVGLALNAHFPLCVSAGMFGIPCPGCGLTRASRLLLGGEFGPAFALHPLVIPLAPLYLAALGTLLFEYVRGPQPTRSATPSFFTQRLVTRFALLLLLGTVGVWLLRFAGFFGGPVAVESYQTWAKTYAAEHTH